MIKPKNYDKKQEKSFIYKHLDPEITVNIRTDFPIVYSDNYRFEFDIGTEGTSIVLTFAQTFHSAAFISNAAIFQMFRINSLRMDVRNVFEPKPGQSYVTYGICFYPTVSTEPLNPYVVMNADKAFLISSKQPWVFQELVFPKSYVNNIDNQGLGTWNSCHYNTFLHDMPCGIYIGNDLIITQSRFHIAYITVTWNVSFRGLYTSL